MQLHKGAHIFGEVLNVLRYFPEGQEDTFADYRYNVEKYLMFGLFSHRFRCFALLVFSGMFRWNLLFIHDLRLHYYILAAAMIYHELGACPFPIILAGFPLYQ